MVSPKEHKEGGKRSEEVADIISSQYNEYDEWIIITTFYSALHYVECELMRTGLSTSSHDRRQQHIEKCPTMDQSIYRRYRYLHDISEEARYNCKRFPPNEVEQAYSILIEIKHKLDY